MSDKNIIYFKRKNESDGVYSSLVDGKDIMITNQEIFPVEVLDDKSNDNLIEALESDPELIKVVAASEPDQEIVGYSEMTKKELLQECENRELEVDYSKIKNLSKDDLIDILEEDDETNSSAENDQGEQGPE